MASRDTGGLQEGESGMTEHEPAEDGTLALEGTPRAVFGQMIKFFRVKAGLTQDQLGALAHVSGKTIASYERARRVPPWETTVLIDAVPELKTNGALCELWRQFEDAMNYQSYPGGFQDWWEQITLAKRLRWYEPNLVPGMLQTESYARTVYRTRFGVTDERVEELVARRLKQQEILRRAHPPAFWVIIEEWVLRRLVGGPRVMYEQVERLIEAAGQPSIVVEVIRSTVGADAGLDGGAFVIADLDDESSLGYQDGTVRGQQIRDHKDVEVMELTWDTLRHEAEPRAGSLALLEEAAKSCKSVV